jgi:HD-GYP domain-containing protein (c-di-GMP phosphodiesterase class II)/DNA-binding CsgD family transcriptional regulator
MADEELRLADLLCALSVSLDLAMDQAPEKSIRSCLVAVGLARRLGLPDAEVCDVYYATLLRHLGCTATTHEETYLVGPNELGLRPQAERTDPGNHREVLALLLQSGRGAGIQRPRYLARMIRAGSTGERAILRAICEVGSMLAERLHLGPGVVRALYQLLERWDGSGTPHGLSGEQIAIPARIGEVATQAVIFDRLGGPEAAVDVVKRRSGGMLDPEVVREFELAGRDLLAELESLDVWQVALDREPPPQRRVSAARIDEVARTFADFVDLKSPYLLGHSSEVAELAEAAAHRLALDQNDCTQLRRAALLHDLGRVGVPTGVWEKSGPLTRSEWEQVRLHPYYSERILSRSPVLAPAGRIAGLHHERHDGSGYPHRIDGRDIAVSPGILATADAYSAMTSVRPHRAACSPTEAADALTAEARAGRFDPQCVQAVLDATGHPARVPRFWPAGMSDREVEVLRLLATGLTNAQIAKVLVVSPRTAEHHVQHIYARIGVSTRASAALYAMQHGLLGR